MEEEKGSCHTEDGMALFGHGKTPKNTCFDSNATPTNETGNREQEDGSECGIKNRRTEL